MRGNECIEGVRVEDRRSVLEPGGSSLHCTEIRIYEQTHFDLIGMPRASFSRSHDRDRRLRVFCRSEQGAIVWSIRIKAEKVYVQVQSRAVYM